MHLMDLEVQFLEENFLGGISMPISTGHLLPQAD